MNIKLLTVLFLIVFTSLTKADTIFEDSFESGDLKSTSTDDFSWSTPNRTSVVNDDQFVIWNGSNIMNGPVSGREWEGASGSNSLRFRYASGQSMAEQRFHIGKAHEDIWVQFSVRVPINFKHNDKSPSNNKFFALWMDNYSSKGAGPTVAWEFWNDGNNGSNLKFHSSKGGYEIMGGHNQSTPFIKYPDDQGKWMNIVIHVKAARSKDSNDGIIELYRRWENESNYQQLHHTESADIAIPSTGPSGWASGYLLGWSNPAYSATTEWLLDDFKLMTHNPISLSSKSPPKSPASLKVNAIAN